jgi:hypothetical protein
LFLDLCDDALIPISWALRFIRITALFADKGVVMEVVRLPSRGNRKLVPTVNGSLRTDNALRVAIRLGKEPRSQSANSRGKRTFLLQARFRKKPKKLYETQSFVNYRSARRVC